MATTHEMTNVGSDRSLLANIAKDAKATLQTEELEAVADRGYFKRGDPGVRGGRHRSYAAKAK